MSRQQALRPIAGGRGTRYQVLVRQTTLDDLVDEVSSLEAEKLELAERCLPLARQLRLMAQVVGPQSVAVADELTRLLERAQRQSEPRRAA